MATHFCAVQHSVSQVSSFPRKLTLIGGSSASSKENTRSSRWFNIEDLDTNRIMNPLVLQTMQHPPVDESDFNLA